MFATPGVYPALVRFANSDPQINSDFKPDVRSLSFSVDLTRDGTAVPDAHVGRQDFSLQNAATLPINDARAFLATIKLLTASNPAAGLWSLNVDEESIVNMRVTPFRMFLVPAFLATVLTVLTSAPAHAYGAAHVGYTTVSPTGNVQQYGATVASGPGGSYAHTSNTTAIGAYGGTYQGSSARVYSPTTYQGYSAAGYSAAGYSAAVSITGVVRYP